MQSAQAGKSEVVSKLEAISLLVGVKPQSLIDRQKEEKAHAYL
jgi:hypothetical protein